MLLPQRAEIRSQMEHLSGIIAGMAYRRDPVSELFDTGAAALLARAYQRPGAWAGTRVRPPDVGHIAFALRQGINLFRPDSQAGDRWTRAFIRACYYQNTWHVWAGQVAARRRMYKNPQAIRYQVGSWNRGWAVRIMVADGGAQGYAAASRQAASYVDDEGLRSDPDTRDWQAQV